MLIPKAYLRPSQMRWFILALFEEARVEG